MFYRDFVASLTCFINEGSKAVGGALPVAHQLLRFGERAFGFVQKISMLSLARFATEADLNVICLRPFAEICVCGQSAAQLQNQSFLLRPQRFGCGEQIVKAPLWMGFCPGGFAGIHCRQDIFYLRVGLYGISPLCQLRIRYEEAPSASVSAPSSCSEVNGFSRVAMAPRSRAVSSALVSAGPWFPEMTITFACGAAARISDKVSSPPFRGIQTSRITAS